MQKLSGLPWIADFRDPMAHEGYPADRRTWDSFRRVESKVFSRASSMVFTTQGASRFYAQRYPNRSQDLHVIANGFDERAFAAAPPAARDWGARWLLLHSGVVYPEWRDPGPLFAAIKRLRDQNFPDIDRLLLRFRASEHDSFVHQRAQEHGLLNQVELLPALAYRDALAEMQSADALLALQSVDCGDQIPAKAYEYLRCRRPVLALADAGSETARLFQQTPLAHSAALESVPEIEAALCRLIEALRKQDKATTPLDADWLFSNSRQGQTRALASLLDQSTSQHLEHIARHVARGMQ
ncbi:hypothetical protein LNV09_15230 [Paucibacter sp. B2R-40]|nr:hypothetical protein [Paucibacter sp. B2R-40]MCV2355502.1 hypothetical protein [Paucibacter sp. B2R-40]